MNKRERKILHDVYRDCKELEKRNDLTEYGKGQMDLCKKFLKSLA